MGRGVSVTRVRKIMQTVSKSDPSGCSTHSHPGTDLTPVVRLWQWSGPFLYAACRVLAVSGCCCCHIYAAAHIPLRTACRPTSYTPSAALLALLHAAVSMVSVCNAVGSCAARGHFLRCFVQIGFMGPAFFLTQLSKVTTAGQAVGCMMACQGLDAFSQSGLYSNHQVSLQCL